VRVGEDWKARLRAGCPELPFDRQRRFLESYKVPYTVTSVLIPDLALCDFFEEAARLGGRAQAAANWIVNDLLRELRAARICLGESRIRPAHVAELVGLVESGAISGQAAKEVFAGMFGTGEMPASVVARLGLGTGPDPAELERWCREAIAANPKSAADFRGGKDSALNAFKGQVMRAAKGKADPRQVDSTLRRLLAESPV